MFYVQLYFKTVVKKNVFNHVSLLISIFQFILKVVIVQLSYMMLKFLLLPKAQLCMLFQIMP